MITRKCAPRPFETTRRDGQLVVILLLAMAGTLPAKGQERVASEGGSIAGSIDSTWIRRTPAVVFVKKVPGEHAPPEDHAVMDQRKMAFIPHLLPVLRGTQVDFPNNDAVRHNVFSPSRSARQFNVGLYPAGSSRTVTFENVGVVPLLCNVHSEMLAFIAVLRNPYFATTDKEGHFRIDEVPSGKYELTFWHEKLAPQTAKIPVVSGKTTKVTFRNLKRTRQYRVKLVP